MYIAEMRHFLETKQIGIEGGQEHTPLFKYLDRFNNARGAKEMELRDVYIWVLIQILTWLGTACLACIIYY